MFLNSLGMFSFSETRRALTQRRDDSAVAKFYRTPGGCWGRCLNSSCTRRSSKASERQAKSIEFTSVQQCHILISLDLSSHPRLFPTRHDATVATELPLGGALSEVTGPTEHRRRRPALLLRSELMQCCYGRPAGDPLGGFELLSIYSATCRRTTNNAAKRQHGHNFQLLEAPR